MCSVASQQTTQKPQQRRIQGATQSQCSNFQCSGQGPVPPRIFGPRTCPPAWLACTLTRPEVCSLADPALWQPLLSQGPTLRVQNERRGATGTGPGSTRKNNLLLGDIFAVSSRRTSGPLAKQGKPSGGPVGKKLFFRNRIERICRTPGIEHTQHRGIDEQAATRQERTENWERTTWLDQLRSEFGGTPGGGTLNYRRARQC